MLSRRDWGMMDRCYSGMLKNKYENRLVRFLTLTTAPHVVSINNLDNNDKLKLIKKNFDALRKRYEKEFKRPFGEYFRVSTLEGNGVIHIVFNGSYIPKNWIMMNWNELHGSQVIDIRYPRGSPFDGSMYIISQYVAGQDGKKIFGYSRNWVYPGFLDHMKECKDCCKIFTDPRTNQFGMTWYPVDYGKYKKYWRIFLKKRLNGEVSRPYEVTHVT